MLLGHVENIRIEAVVFDLDGTLIRSAIDFKLMKERVLAYLRTLPLPEDFPDQRRSLAELVLQAKDHLEGEPSASFRLGELEWRIEVICTEVEMATVDRTERLDDAPAIISWLHVKGIKVGILTRASRSYARRALALVGLEGGYETLLCRDDHPLWEAKPNHLALERVATLLDTKVERCLMVGDHYLDLECARQAGAPFAAVLSGSFDRQRWQEHRPRWLMENVGGLRELLRE